MGNYKCPRCGMIVVADHPSGLVCGNCGYGAPAATAQGWGAPPPPPSYGQPYGAQIPQAGIMHGAGPRCPRCGSTHTQKGGIPMWAIICAIVGFFIVCVLSLLFLIAKDDNLCYNCGMKWRG